MIGKQEIIAKSKEFDTHTSNVQRDYVLDGFWQGSISRLVWEAN